MRSGLARLDRRKTMETAGETKRGSNNQKGFQEVQRMRCIGRTSFNVSKNNKMAAGEAYQEVPWPPEFVKPADCGVSNNEGNGKTGQ